MSDTKENVLEKLRAKKGRAAAINAMCCMCIYDPDALGCGSWRKQVEECTSYDCPLFEYRPVTTGGKKEDG
jgi:hypothetical protein